MVSDPFQLLGLRPGATVPEIEAAYHAQTSRWRELQRNPLRQQEARQMIDALYEAREAALARASAGLHAPAASGAASAFGWGAGSAPLPGGAPDAAACPGCGYTGNPPDAVYCTRPNCGYELMPECPNCRRKVRWHDAVCAYCRCNIWQERRKNLQSTYDAARKRFNDLRAERALLSNRSADTRSQRREVLEKYGDPAQKEKTSSVSSGLGCLAFVAVLLIGFNSAFFGGGDLFVGLLGVLAAIIIVPILVMALASSTPQSALLPSATKRLDDLIEDAESALHAASNALQEHESRAPTP